MKGLSVLIFSRGYPDNVLRVVRNVYDAADEIVVLDASDRKDNSYLKRAGKAAGLKKMEVLPMIALGYPDPLRMYGIGRCRYDWVLLIDTDELLSDGLKGCIREVIKGNAHAYALRRYEEVRDLNSMPMFSTWQVRLFRKDYVEFQGLPHEQPIVSGILKRLDEPNCYMMHMSAMMSRKTQLDYGEMEKFERLTYRMYREKMLGYASKLRTHEDRKASSTLSGRIIGGWMGFYQYITMRKDEQELSGFDYFLYYSMLDLAYYTLEGNVKGIFGIIPSELRHLKRINRWKNSREGRRVFEISKIINKVGITRFLGLDKKANVERLIRKYQYKEGGIGLLFKLINERYDSMKGAKHG